MVQEYSAPMRLHKHTFEMVMAAYERRFPRCPQIPVVVECITLEDTWSLDHSHRDTVRRAKLTLEAPYIIKKMIGIDFIYFVHRTHLDLKKRILDIDSINETLSSHIEIIERCKYYVSPENSEWTCFDQNLSLDIKNLIGFESTAEKIAMKQYATMNAKGKDLIESFMQEVNNDGIFELAQWSESTPLYNAELRRIISRGLPPTTTSPPASPKDTEEPLSPEEVRKASSMIVNRRTSTLLRIKSEAVLQTPIESPKEGTSKDKSSSIARIPPIKTEIDNLRFTSMLLLREKNLQESNIASGKYNPCRCDLTVRRECLGPPQGVTDWDSLVIILVCAFVLLFAMVSPFNILLPRQPNREL